MPLIEIRWKHRKTGEVGFCQPMKREIADRYMAESAMDLAPLYEFEAREVSGSSEGVA